MHSRIRDEFDWYGNIEIPYPHRLVIRTGNEPPILIDESDRVDWSQVLIVLLSDLS